VLAVSGLTGGHSGMDIHLGRANANKVLNQLLLDAAASGARIAAIDSGGLRNAIPREGSATVVVEQSDTAEFRRRVEQRAEALRQHFSATDPGLSVSLQPSDLPDTVVAPVFQKDWLQAVDACLNGVYRMSPDIDGLVQTSNNLARVKLAGGEYEVMCLTRGSVDEEKLELARSLAATFETIGARVALTGEYPGWAPKPDAPIVKILSELYEERFGSEAKVMACHAGLECGILGSNYPDMQMISFGPNIRGAHSPDEKVQVSSVQKFWGLLLELLKRIPES
jgi:dipeptidase D